MGWMSARFRRVLAPWLVGALLAAPGILPLCDLHFDCGCLLPGLGGWRHCDIHTAGPPDCPWCAYPAVFLLTLALSLASGLGLILPLRGRAHYAVLLLASATGFLLGGLVSGIATSLILGRPILAGW